MSRVIRLLCLCDGDGCGAKGVGTVHWFENGPRRYLYEDDRYLHKLPKGWQVVRDADGYFRDLCPECAERYRATSEEPTLGKLLSDLTQAKRY